MSDIHELAKRIKYLEGLRDEYKEQAEELRTELRALVEEPGKYDAGEYIVQVSTNRRFNEKKAAAALDPKEFELVSKTVVDAAKFKALFPELIEDVSDNGALRLTIKDKSEEEL